MRSIVHDKELQYIFERVCHWADHYGRILPEMRFFVLNQPEFRSLLEKRVYPTSPINLWEGKSSAKSRFQSENGLDRSIYYEVVQTGDPSYAYLNHTNTHTTQASVMAHVVGHCEFSELNVMKDSDKDRTERVMWLVKKINTHVNKMGVDNYLSYWNNCESVVPLIAPNSQFNLKNSVETDTVSDSIREEMEAEERDEGKVKLFNPFSSTIDSILKNQSDESLVSKDKISKQVSETIDRVGYKLKAPCQDILGFLKEYAPKSTGEKYILEYLYTVNKHNDFVGRTQIMNEGWAMYWEKKIMNKLFEEGTVKEVIDYAKVFAGVCYPRPYFQRNPYQLGYALWNHIEELFEKGKVSIEYLEEINKDKKDAWDTGCKDEDPMVRMERIVRTCTDYEFLRRFLTDDLIEELHLNRIHISLAKQYGLTRDDIKKADDNWVWLHTDGIKDEMLKFFDDFGRPMLYIIDSDFMDGGLLIFHDNKGKDLREDWIHPTLKNMTYIWKAPVSIISGDKFYRTLGSGDSAGMESLDIDTLDFGSIRESMASNIKPFTL
jgi:stage V sporulation protein R